MTILFKQPGSRAVLCGACLPEVDRLFAVELDPALFPETYDLLRCACCGTHGHADEARTRKRIARTG